MLTRKSCTQDWTGTENTGYTGNTTSHKKKPFADGWSAVPLAGAAKPHETVKATTAEEPKAAHPADDNVLNYVNNAVEFMITHNFTGDGKEPEEWTSSNGSGWTGDIHTRSRDG